MDDVRITVQDDSYDYSSEDEQNSPWIHYSLEDEEPDSLTQSIPGKVKNSLKALGRRLLINMTNGNGIPLATLSAQFALFTAILSVRETGFYAEYDSRGFKTALSYHISALLVSNSWRLRKSGFIRRSCGFKANTTANGVCLILAILLEKFYEKSLSSLGFALSIAVSFLILLVIIRPSTDLGFFGFLIGDVGSVAYNLFGLKFRTCIVVASCILLLGFKSWLDKNWLEGEVSVPPPKRFSKSKIIEAVTVAGFYLVWDYNLFRTNFQNLNLPDSDSKSGTSISLIAIVSCVVISCVWLALILVPRVYLLFRIVRASLLIQLILRKDKWWNKFLLKGNDSSDYWLNLALKLSLEHVKDGVALLTDANITQLKRELEDQPINDLKQESAISRWSRARTRAAKVGKGLSKDEKARKLALQHWLEAIDPRHRYGRNLHMYYDVWLGSESSQPFFYWLDVGEGKEVNLEKCPRNILHRQCIKYLGPKEREEYEVIVERGRLVYRQSGVPVETVEGFKWIFVLSTARALYVGQKKKGLFLHSSFLAGGATTAAGRLVAHGGALEAIWPYSSHYLPTEENFKEFISFLKEKHVDLSNVKTCS